MTQLVFPKPRSRVGLNLLKSVLQVRQTCLGEQKDLDNSLSFEKKNYDLIKTFHMPGSGGSYVKMISDLGKIATLKEFLSSRKEQ